MADRIAICQSAFEAWNRRDLDEVAALYESNAVIVLPENWPDARAIEGRDAIRDFYVSYERTWSEGSVVEPTEFREEGDRVVVPVVSKGASKGGGVPLDFEYTMVFTVPEDLIGKVEFHFGHDAEAGSAT